MHDFIKSIVSIILLTLFIACNQASSIKSKTHTDSSNIKSLVSLSLQKADTIFDETKSEPFFIVQVASGYNFDSLKLVSTTAASILGSEFDMLNRIYNPSKGIIVPHNSDDEVYRGEYYPRRPFGEQNFVSIEMSSGFDENESDTLKMVVLASMFKSKDKADSITALLRNEISTVKTVKRDLFLGCMH